MKKITVTPAPKLQHPKLYPVALFYTFIVVAVTTYLLYKFDEITSYILEQNIGGSGVGLFMAIATVSAGVFSLPYLLRVDVSPLMRLVSCAAAFLAPLGWLLAAWWMEINLGRSEALATMLVAHVSVLLALVAVWVIGLPLKPLKKQR